MKVPPLDPAKPAVWTTLGNVNTEHLQQFIEWSRHGDTIKFRHVYKFDDVVVREDACAHVVAGLSTLTEQALIA